MKTKEFLDKILRDFFPQDGVWYSNCFSKSKVLDEIYLPCHTRDNDWLTSLIIKKYNLDSSDKEIVFNYIVTSEQFNKSRYEYEQKIVSWQIEWMKNGGSRWLADNKYGSEFISFSPNYDKGFRKGIVDTLLAIGMNIDAIEEGIEKNAYKWRESIMKISFNNLYSVSPFTSWNDCLLDTPSQEHYEKWLKLRLYEYYIEHKDSVDKYGTILPEMKMTELEVTELKKWLKIEHEKRMIKISEFGNKSYFTNVPKIKVNDFNGDDFLSISKVQKLKHSKQSNKVNKPPRLDFKTWLYLYITKALKVEHTPVVKVEEKRRMYVKYSKKNEVYIFKDYAEYKAFFLMYLDSIDEAVIDLAIYAKGSKGQIIALKGLCEHIIIKRKVNDFYSSITKEQIDKIHAKGKLTPLEAVQSWESHNLCIEGNKAIFSKDRCKYFNQNCHECLMEIASHKLEHDNVDFKVETQGPTLKKIKNQNINNEFN